MRPNWFLSLLIGCNLVFASGANAETLINGAGATFPYPLYSKWFSEYQKTHPDTQINYQSIGSGGGIRQFTEKTVDFGASDAPMTDEQITKAQGNVVHVPMALGAVVVTYNLPGLHAPLKLTGAAIADIFLGKLTKWNDPELASLNPGAELPSDPILVTHRSDGSGTSAVFTDYLAKVSHEWKEKVGAGTAVDWPVGLGGKGNEGVSGLIKQTPGSIGYVELIYAANNGLPVALLRNQAGNFTQASPASVTAAAASSLSSIPGDFRISITDAAGQNSYPISSFTYLLLPKTLTGDKGKKLLAFVQWAITDGQKDCEPLKYAALPRALISRIQAALKTIKAD